MMDIDALFKRRKVNIERLVPFGFTKDANGYAYSTSLIDGQFKMTVIITEKGNVSAELVDNSTGDNYVLHRVSSATGAFVGRVREEYERVLTIIAGACSEPDIFKSKGARQIVQYVREKYQDELEFLWERFPDNAIFRRKDSKKWYAALLTVQKEKLGLSGEGAIEIIDLHMKPEDVSRLVDGKRYLPGFHMNKKHWVTVCLDGTVPMEEIFQRIDESYALAAK